ncbi:putative aspartic-type endopeptidase OPSB [Glarea lozoyensis 74030]|uniref:Putative aspartic-type endopeptidase OPSB n=1 Tax=Glarea lozoyensis (strain ATCC 74030 / MF5533) TaxID=1104152 RepID=H0EHG2_GLAL7|nr:putative aspartic-type endopeptidase OPSB [Glarea lozoyensis 74030]
MDELVIQVTSTNGRPLTFSDGTRACVFGVAPAGSSTAVLGDTFIRSAYLVYDLANNEISIAQTTFNATATNVLEITTGSDSVPSATAVTNPVAASQGLNEAPVAGVASPQSTPAPLGFGAMAAVGAGLFYAAM